MLEKRRNRMILAFKSAKYGEKCFHFSQKKPSRKIIFNREGELIEK